MSKRRVTPTDPVKLCLSGRVRRAQKRLDFPPFFDLLGCSETLVSGQRRPDCGCDNQLVNQLFIYKV